MLEISVFVVILILDQVSKVLSADLLPKLSNGALVLIEGVLELTYVKNFGAAFGMLQNANWLFIPITIIACGLFTWFLIKHRKDMPDLMRLSLALILSGAIGNFIDRVFIGFVRDMIYVSAINFPVFNIADSAITVGCILLLLDSFFFKGKHFLDLLDSKQTKSANKDGGTE